MYVTKVKASSSGEDQNVRGPFMDPQAAAFLAEDELREELKRIFNEGPTEYDENQIEGWAYQLTLGEEVFVNTMRRKMHLKKRMQFPQRKKRTGTFINPGEFALLMTEEYLSMTSSHSGFISIRMKYKRQGLLNVSGFHIDPWFRGHLVFAVYNAGPQRVYVQRGDPIFMMVIARLSSAANYKRTDANNQNIDEIPSDWISDIKGGETVTLIGLNQKVEELLMKNKIIGAVLLSIVTVIVGLVLTGVIEF